MKHNFNEWWGTSCVKYQVDKYTEVHSEPCQTSKMELFVKIINGFYPLTIFTKSSISGVWQSSEYDSDCCVMKSPIDSILTFINTSLWKLFVKYHEKTIIDKKYWFLKCFFRRYCVLHHYYGNIMLLCLSLLPLLFYLIIIIILNTFEILRSYILKYSN